MELGLNRLPWYGQVGAFVVVAALMYGAFHFYWVRPTQAEIAVRQGELDEKRAQISAALAVTGQLPEIEAQVAQLEARLGTLRAVLPEQRDVADLLRQVEELAIRSNLTIQGFTPQPVAPRELHEEWPIRLGFEGTYHNLGLFFDRISKLSRIINVSGVSIRALEPAEVNNTITGECIATTFVLLETPPPGATPVPVGGGNQRWWLAQRGERP